MILHECKLGNIHEHSTFSAGKSVTPCTTPSCRKSVSREDLAPYSTSVDRELQQLVAAGRLTKAAQGFITPPEKCFW